MKLLRSKRTITIFTLKNLSIIGFEMWCILDEKIIVIIIEGGLKLCNRNNVAATKLMILCSLEKRLLFQYFSVQTQSTKRSGYHFRDRGRNGKNNTETTGKVIQLILRGILFAFNYKCIVLQVELQRLHVNRCQFCILITGKNRLFWFPVLSFFI